MSTEVALAVVEPVVDKHADELLALRRDLHAHPELSWQEVRTTDLVTHHLDEVGGRLTRSGGAGGVAAVRDETGPVGGRLPGGGEAGVVAEIGDETGPVVPLRAAPAALPVNDTTTDPWQSQVPG